MIVSIKDSVKLFGISIMTCCAVTVCNMFLNYYLDLTAIAGLIDNPYAQMFYDAQIMTSKVVCAVSGGCLAITTVVMLFFYIKHYIDSHSKEIGILKALGYSDFKIAGDCSHFGLCFDCSMQQPVKASPALRQSIEGYCKGKGENQKHKR